MSAILPKISYPVPSNRNGTEFSSAEDLLAVLGGESSGHYLVGSQGMWHGGIHITDATVPWCALSTDSEEEKAYLRQPYKGEQFIRCMADGEIVAFRVCKDYASEAIPWRDEHLHLSTSFVLVRHRVQPGDTPASGLTFYTLYMQLAPFAAYAPLGGVLERKTRGTQRYYASADDVLAGKAGGTLAKDMLVTLSNNIITRHSDGRQFTEVTMAAETKNAAGVTVLAGTKVWTVSDQGFLISAAPSVPAPSWWAKCSPAYRSQPAGSVNCTARTNWQYYLSSDDVLQGKKAGALTAGFPLTYEPGNTAQQVTRPGKTPDEASRAFSLVTLGRDVGKLKKGDRVWVVSDGDSLTPQTATASGGHPVFGDVVVPSVPVAISAGDSIGHMGFYQLPEENGKRSRYQVHIECLSMDDSLPALLTNPEHAGEQSPAFLKYPEGATLFVKNGEGEMADSTRKTKSPGILTLSKVPVLEADGQPAYYQIRPEGGWVGAADVQKISQYALADRGFVTLNKAGTSFDLIDGTLQPDNIVKVILEQLHKAAQAETRPAYALNQYNYQRLLEKIDSNKDGHYSIDEYLQAIHIVSYRDRLQRIIAKHASEWYYGKDDPLWKTYLDTLKTDGALWKTYLEAFIDKMAWMKQVQGMGPEPWHMHPVTFLDAYVEKFSDTINFQTSLGVYRISKKSANLILKAEGYKRSPYVPQGSSASGVTIGYGYDLGQQTVSKMRAMLSGYFTEVQLTRLEEAIGLKGSNASAVIPSLIDITISEKDAVSLAMKMKSNYAQIVVDTYPEVLKTHPHCQGAMLSLVINRGTSFYKPSIASRIEMRNIHDDFVSGGLSDIPNQFRSMKRLWVGKGLDGLITRREDEAKLFEEGLSQ